jgi:hypothetical protein
MNNGVKNTRVASPASPQVDGKSVQATITTELEFHGKFYTAFQASPRSHARTRAAGACNV